MLPLYLSIEGLYSYQEKQEIDFKTLTEAGLFGIFGYVGSGKSSILEAISMALYGETERLNKQEKRTYNMLNLKSNAACIVFEFLNFENRKFRFVAQWKRKKKFEDTSSLERYAYEWIHEQWIPLNSNDGQAITSLTYANFRRTIIIPQGQFKEFLELKGKERSDMMKELFNLDRFDLGPKVATLQRQNNSQLDVLKGALSGFETISTELLETKNIELKEAQALLVDKRQAFLTLELLHKQLLEAQQHRLELQKQQQELSELKNQQPKIEQWKLDLQRYEKTHQAFRELLNITQALNKEKEQLTYKIESLSANKSKLLERKTLQDEQWKSIAEEFNNLERYRSEIEDLKLIIDSANKQQRKAEVQARLHNGRPHLDKAQMEASTLTVEIATQEALLEDLQQSKMDTSMLLELENWYQQEENMLKNGRSLSEKINVLQEEISAIETAFEQQGLSVNSWETELDEQDSAMRSAQQAVHQQETQLKVQLKLSEFAHNLHEGEACPLCGSLSHPQPMGIENLSELENEIVAKFESLNLGLLTLQNKRKHSTRQASFRQDKQQQCEALQISINAHEQQVEAHLKSFCWPNFSAQNKDAFSSYKALNKEKEAAIKMADLNLKTLRQDLQEKLTLIEKYKVNLVKFEQEIAVLSGILQQNEAQLRQLKIADYAHIEGIKLMERKQALEESILQIDHTYKLLTESINLLNNELASINGQRKEAKDQFQQIIQLLSSRQSEIAALLQAHNYNDIMEVQTVLNKNLDVQAMQKIINKFQVELQVVETKIAALETKTQHDNFSNTLFEEKTAIFKEKKEELELQISLTAALETERTRLQVEYQKKEKLLEAFEKLNLRKGNLTTMDNLFRGSGFVNYVSSIHLQQLCEMANRRFHRLTKNQLSLSINESNEFEVIDYLNNGYSRSVKTLSGGQGFQASLCLALALAENIQALNKAEKNFFFIDEGFGTQDLESINTVFETLQYLNLENRVVGIISHVEELKERIPRSITITKDIERGSIVNVN